MGLLPFAEPVRSAATEALLDMLCHPFPRVRKVTAERLYVKLLELDAGAPGGGGGGGGDVALAALAETAWDGDLAAVAAVRDSLYGCLGIAMPALRLGQAPAPGAGKERTREAEDANFDSYGALMREVGY